MRVFKWSPDFDVFCESPIAAIWCNLIALPIHLFDTAALFAIGKLLGTPIQIDRATASKSRLSFARMCIEIDITKPPPDEIILDIGGRETVQKIKWDKIPSYCMECKHVGHSSEVCYANGRGERPAKRNYNMAPPSARPQEPVWNNEMSSSPRQQVADQVSPHRPKVAPPRKQNEGCLGGTVTNSPPDILGDLIEPGSSEAGFQPRGRRKNRVRRSDHSPSNSREQGKTEGLVPRGATRSRSTPRHRSWSPTQAGSKGKESNPLLDNLSEAFHREIITSNKYYKLMEDGTFDTEILEEDEEFDMEIITGDCPDPRAAGSSGVGGNLNDSKLQQIEYQKRSPLPSGMGPCC